MHDYIWPGIVSSLALLVYGAYLATTMPIDVFPDLDRPRVVIITECAGLATEEVEALVTEPIEVALLGASGVEAGRSQSTAGLTVIYVEFNWDVDVRAARQTVQERLSAVAGVLPQGIRPQMTPTASIMGQIQASSRRARPCTCQARLSRLLRESSGLSSAMHRPLAVDTPTRNPV